MSVGRSTILSNLHKLFDLICRALESSFSHIPSQVFNFVYCFGQSGSHSCIRHLTFNKLELQGASRPSSWCQCLYLTEVDNVTNIEECD